MCESTLKIGGYGCDVKLHCARQDDHSLADKHFARLNRRMYEWFDRSPAHQYGGWHRLMVGM